MPDFLHWRRPRPGTEYFALNSRFFVQQPVFPAHGGRCLRLNFVGRKAMNVMAANKPSEKTKSVSRQKKSEPKQENKILTYNGKPLVRCGNLIYYGNPEDKYVVTFRLEDQEPLGDLQIAKRVIIELKTNEGKNAQLIRQAERDGLYKALDIGMFWLEQALENS